MEVKSGQKVEVTAGRNGLTGALADFRVGTKIYMAVLCAALVALVVGVLGMIRLSSLNDDIKAMKAQHVDSSLQLSIMRGALAGEFQALFGWALVPAAQKAASRDALPPLDEEFLTAAEKYRTLSAGSAARQADVAEVVERFTFYQQLRDVALFGEEPDAGVEIPPVDQRTAAWTQTQDALRAAVVKLQDTESNESATMAAHAEDTYNSARTQMIVCLVVGLVLAIAIAVLVSRLIGRQLASVSAALGAVAEGDLTVGAEVLARDELGAMAVAVNTAREGLRSMVTRLTTSSQTLGVSTERLTRVAEEIGESAQNAAAQANVAATAAGDVSLNVQTVAAGSEEMGASIREIASNASEAARVASEAVGVADSANAVRKPSTVMIPMAMCESSNASGIIVSAIIVRIAPAARAVIAASTAGLASPSSV